METYKLMLNPYSTLREMLRRIKVGDRVSVSIKAAEGAHGYSQQTVRQCAVNEGVGGKKFTCNFDRDTFTMYVTRTA
jgi:hypothetical protein